jgi:hypothetical protein
MYGLYDEGAISHGVEKILGPKFNLVPGVHLLNI